MQGEVHRTAVQRGEHKPELLGQAHSPRPSTVTICPWQRNVRGATKKRTKRAEPTTATTAREGRFDEVLARVVDRKWEKALNRVGHSGKIAVAVREFIGSPD